MKTTMSDKKDSMLHIRISSTDLEKIKGYADKLGMTQSEFCLNALLAAIGEDLEKPAMNNVLTRLAALERIVFQSQQAA
jgi:uncharacterized protein (DUF1778 family)